MLGRLNPRRTLLNTAKNKRRKRPRRKVTNGGKYGKIFTNDC